MDIVPWEKIKKIKTLHTHGKAEWRIIMSTENKVVVNETNNEVVTGQSGTVQLSTAIKEMFAKADFVKQYERSETSEDGAEVTYHVRKFNLVNPKKDITTLTVQDRDFIESAEKVLAVGDIKNATDFVVYRELYKLSVNEIIAKTSFKTYNALASALFGISSSYASSYSRVGKYFVDDSYNLVDERLDGFKGAHLMELLPLVNKEEPDTRKAIATVFTLLNESKITTAMSTKALRKVVRDYLDGKSEDSSEKEDNAGKTKKSNKEVIENLNKKVSQLEDEKKRLVDATDVLEKDNMDTVAKLREANDRITVLTDVSKMTDLEIANRIMSDLLELKNRGIKVISADKVISSLEKIGE